jgi:hypothetical protein
VCGGEVQEESRSCRPPFTCSSVDMNLLLSKYPGSSTMGVLIKAKSLLSFACGNYPILNGCFYLKYFSFKTEFDRG